MSDLSNSNYKLMQFFFKWNKNETKKFLTKNSLTLDNREKNIKFNSYISIIFIYNQYQKQRR